MLKVVGNNDFFAKEFVNLNSRECILLLEFSKETYAYTILHKTTNKVIYSVAIEIDLDWFQCQNEHLETIFKHLEIFNFTFDEVLVLSNLGKDTLIPNRFYKEDLAAEFLKINEDLSQIDYTIKKTSLDFLNYQFIYAFPKNLEKYLNQNLLGLTYSSSEAVLINFFYNQIKSGPYVNAHIEKNTIHFCFLEDRELKYSNSFSYQNKEELLFNILNCYKQLGLNTEKTRLNISGALAKDAPAYQLFYNYIKYISFQERPLKLNFSKKLSEDKGHYFMSHYAALL